MYQPTIFPDRSRRTTFRNSSPCPFVLAMKFRSQVSDLASYSGQSEYPFRNSRWQANSVSPSSSAPLREGSFRQNGLNESLPARPAAAAQIGLIASVMKLTAELAVIC